MGHRPPSRPAAALALLLFALLSAVVPAAAAPRHTSADTVDIELFSREGCPHCAAAKLYLRELELRRPELRVRVSDVVLDAAARARLEELAERTGQSAVSVPAFDVRGQLIVGFDGAARTGRAVEAALAGGAAPADGTSVPSCGLEVEAGCEEPGKHPRVTVPLLGSVDVRQVGLPVLTLALGLVDGFNPCAMWVLLFLLSMLATLRDRRRMALIAGVFLFVSAAAYYAFMAAWLNVFLFLGVSRSLQLALGLLAIVAGGIHVKDFVAFHRGPSLGIPEAAKPAIYRRARGVLAARNLPSALLGVAALAVLVNMVELLCTAGIPAVYTQVLSAWGLPRWQYYAYLGLYDLAYMFDDSLITGIAIVTLSRRKLQEREGRRLKLLGGCVMLLLGSLLLFKPEWLAP